MTLTNVYNYVMIDGATLFDSQPGDIMCGHAVPILLDLDHLHIHILGQAGLRYDTISFNIMYHHLIYLCAETI